VCRSASAAWRRFRVRTAMDTPRSRAPAVQATVKARNRARVGCSAEWKDRRRLAAERVRTTTVRRKTATSHGLPRCMTPPAGSAGRLDDGAHRPLAVPGAPGVGAEGVDLVAFELGVLAGGGQDDAAAVGVDLQGHLIALL